MKLHLTLAVAAALAVASCGPNATSANQDAPPPPEAGEASFPPSADPNPKFFGAPTTEFQSGGDVIVSSAPVRDVTYRVDADVRLEVFVKPVEVPLHVDMISGTGEKLGSTDAPAGQETRIEVQPSEGVPNNIIRFTRQQGGADNASFTIRMRTLPLPG